MALRQPLRPQPASALAFFVLIVAGAALVWWLTNPIYGVLFLVAAPFCAANVFMGGAWNDSPLDLVERVQEYRASGWESTHE